MDVLLNTLKVSLVVGCAVLAVLFLAIRREDRAN